MDYDPSRESSSTPDDKRISSKMFKKYSDSFAQYLLENLSSNSLDSSSVSDSQSTDENHSESSVERNVGYESPTIILLDSDEEVEANQNSTEATLPTRITPTRTTPTRTTPTRTTPTRTTPTRTSSPTSIDNGNLRMSN